MKKYRQGGFIGNCLYASHLFLALFCSAADAATPVSDEYIRGYATSILQRDFQVSAKTLSVESGVVLIEGLEASDVVRDQIKTSLSSIEGVRQVVVAKGGELLPMRGKADVTTEVNVFLPRDLLFKSLLADPRWPHFSASYQQYIQNDQLDGVG